jgi:hypothetical protein
MRTVEFPPMNTAVLRAGAFVFTVIALTTIVHDRPIATSADLQAAVRVSGTRVSVLVPPGFEPVVQAPGFRDKETGSSLVVTEIPGPFAAVRAGLTAEGLATRGMQLLSAEEVRIASRDGVLMAASQQVGGAIFRTWMGVFGTNNATVMVVAAYPEALAGKMSALLRRAVLSAEWGPDVVVDPFEGLLFRLREGKTLKIAGRMSNALMLTRGGTSGPPPPAEPMLVVATSLTEVEVGDLETFAKARLMQTAQVKEITDIEGRTVTVGGSPGYEIRAAARDLKTGAPLVVYQLVAVRGRQYYLVQGLVGAAGADEYIPEFRAVASSLTFVK